MKKLDQYYASVLAYANMITTPEGYVSVKWGDTVIDVNINGKRLATPTTQNRQNSNSLEIFHPLSEQILAPATAVNKEYFRLLRYKLNYTVASAIRAILHMAYSPELQVGLSPEQALKLSALSEISEKAVTTFDEIREGAISSGLETAFIAINIKKGGVVDNEPYAQAGIVRYPFYEAILEDKATKIFGVAVAKKYAKYYRLACEIIFGNIAEDEEQHNRGVNNSEPAPYFQAMLETSYALLNKISTAITELGEPAADEYLSYDLEWKSLWDSSKQDIRKEARVILHQASAVDNTPAVPAVAAASKPMPKPALIPPPPVAASAPIPPPPPPPVAHTPAPAANGRVNVDDFLSRPQYLPTVHPQGNYQAPAYGYQPAPAYGYQPQPAPPYGYQPQQAPVYGYQPQQAPVYGYQPQQAPAYPQSYPGQQRSVKWC